MHETPGVFSYKVDWLDRDGEQIDGDWVESNASRLRVDAPTPQFMTVTVVPSGDFKKQVSHVLATLRYEDEENEYTSEQGFDFTDDKQVQTWKVPLRDPSIRDYKYRYSVVHKDGMVENVPEDTDQWLDGPAGYVVAGIKYDIEVQLHPFLLTYPDHARMVKVDLSYKDAARDINITDSFVFSKENKKIDTWRARTGNGPQPYKMTVTYYASDGKAMVRGPETLTGDAVVLQPAPAPPPDPAPAPTPSGDGDG